LWKEDGMNDATLPAVCRELGIPLARGERFLRQYPAEIPDSKRLAVWRVFPHVETVAAFRRLMQREAAEREVGMRR
jgi:hypothetical protein